MLIVVQTLFTAIACVLLFAGYRWFQRDRTVARLVAAGFLVRAIAGQVLFWISFLQLPIARELQAGNGFWFYASDGRKYFRRALEAASHGIGGVVSIDPTVVSPGFSQILALFALMFGGVASIALVMNLAAYLGTCAVAVKLAGDDTRTARIAVAALSLSPSSILWATQPLKDVLFLFLIAAFVGIAASWMAVWRREEGAFSRAIVITLAMLAVFCVIAGIRWYFALALLVAGGPVLLVAALRTRAPLRALGLLVVTFSGVLGAAVYAAGPYLPPSVHALITSPDLSRAARTPYTLAATLEGAREAYDRLHGSTRIVGTTLADSPHASRFVSGSAALLLPRPIARATGLATMRGGRGLFFFADLDTIFFDIVLVIAILSLLRAPRLQKWRSPLVWLVAGVTLAMGTAFVYAVSNFGALFRYRSMIFIGIALIPVAAAWATRRERDQNP